MPDTPTYVPLRVHSPYSLAEGAIFPTKLSEKLAEWNVPAAAVCDTDSLTGSYTIAGSLSSKGVQPIHGTQLTISHPGLERDRRETSELILLATSEQGYLQICRYLSKAQTTKEPTRLEDILKPSFSSDFLVLTGGPRGPVDKAIMQGHPDRARRRLQSLKSALGDRLYCEIQRQGAAKPHDDALCTMATDLSIACVATSEAWFPDPDYVEAHDVLLCIADGVTLNHDNRRRVDPNGYLKSPDEMAGLFADLPEALENTLEIARRCSFIIQKKKPFLPAFPSDNNRTEAEELRHQAREGLVQKLARIDFSHDGKTALGHGPEDYHKRLDYELGIIENMGFPGYFLIVSDFIRWSKEHDIPVGPGRGSGAGSLVAWCLLITDLDPLRYDLFFERFLNPERVSMPDFDIDFCQENRDKVIDYVRHRYGEDRVAQIGTLGKLKAKAVIRDTGRVLQIPFPIVDRYAKLIPDNPAHPVTLEEATSMDPLASELRGAPEDILKMFEIGKKLEGLYRHQSTHAAGVVIGNQPIGEIVPVYTDQHGTVVTSFDMKSVENTGLVKFDFLGLKTLDVIKGAVEIAERNGAKIHLDTAETEDPETYEMLRRGDSFGVFQFESAGMRKAMIQIQPTQIEDLVALGALYRPGPMENIPTYAEVKAGLAEAQYLHPKMEPTLKETYGIIVYQEQVMRLAQDLAGYTLGGADMLRRAMGKKLKSEMDAQRKIFQEGAEKRGIDAKTASDIFDLIARFADYGFNKSHAAAYGVIAYQTAWLKCHHPEAFLAASMNFDINDVDKISEALEHARRSGIHMLPPDVNASQAMFDVEPFQDRLAVRHALSALKGVGINMARDVIHERETNGPFKDLFDFAMRCKPFINKKMAESLIYAGAMDSLHLNRRAMIEALPAALTDAGHRADEQERGQMTMFDMLPDQQKAALPAVKDWNRYEKLEYQFKIVGHYIDGHPISAVRETLNRMFHNRRIRDVVETPETCPREISLGAVITATTFKKTAKKKSMLILKISDETGITEAIAFEETAEEVREKLKRMSGPAARFTLSVAHRDGDVSLFIRDIEPLVLEDFDRAQAA